MPCAAGSLCALKPDDTSGPPHFTNHGVKDTLSDSEMHRVCHPCVTSTFRKESGEEANSSAGDKNQSTQPVRRPRPAPYTDVAEHFGRLEEVAERCRMTEASYHLRKAKLAWMGSPYLQHRVATLLLQHGRRHQNHSTRNPFWKSTPVVVFGGQKLFMVLKGFPNVVMFDQ